ncbi:MAG: hypothetical protein GXP31_18990 [Kiritimatiellaeota bacterium]|nr:hypothetical protein [Kiritimatiellota bacterium]
MSSGKAFQALALNGGPKARATPWPPRRLFGPEEKAVVVDMFDQAIETGVAFGYNGPEEEAYCREFAAFLGGGYADAVNSGTASVFVALRALDLPAFSEVIVGAVTDPGGLMPVPLLNLVPVIADAAPGCYNSGPEQIEALITPRTSAILVAHIAGEPADIEAIAAVAQRHGLPLIEDCSQSHGATLNGKPVGTFGAIAAFSTMSGKHHCTGAQGGVVFTRNEELSGCMKRAADRGKPFGLPPGSTNCWASLNLNSNELACAIGRVQLRKLPGIIRRRREAVRRLAAGIAEFATVSVPTPLPGADPSYWFLRMVFHPERAKCDKSTFCRALSAEGLPINPSYRGALPHLMDWFVNRRVFGGSGYPWSAPEYTGDRNRQFPCPNANHTMDTQFNLAINESWGPAEISDAVAAFAKLDAAFRRS